MIEIERSNSTVSEIDLACGFYQVFSDYVRGVRAHAFERERESLSSTFFVITRISIETQHSNTNARTRTKNHTTRKARGERIHTQHCLMATPEMIRSAS